MNMRIRITEVTYRLFKSVKYDVLKDENFDIQFLPMTGDVIHLDGIRYKVKQRDFHEMGHQGIILYVEKIY